MTTINLLIVDDEKRFLVTSKKLLERRGVRTITCATGDEALRILDEEPIDVVLLDVKMPGLSGLEVLRRIKRDHPGVEVILLTGHLSAKSVVEGMESGAFEYLIKPLTIEDILDKVKKAYEKKQVGKKRAREEQMDEMARHPLDFGEGRS